MDEQGRKFSVWKPERRLLPWLQLTSLDKTMNEKAELKKLKDQARKPFLSLFMDGRNENGTHLLPVLPDSLGDGGDIADALSEAGDFSETIFSEAEKLGHSVGHNIVTIWDWNKPDYSPGGIGDGYFEYLYICPLLTELFHGTADEQRNILAGLETDDGHQ